MEQTGDEPMAPHVQRRNANATFPVIRTLVARGAARSAGFACFVCALLQQDLIAAHVDFISRSHLTTKSLPFHSCFNNKIQLLWLLTKIMCICVLSPCFDSETYQHYGFYHIGVAAPCAEEVAEHLMSCGTLASISWDAAHLTCHD